ncbi:glutaminyl-peptide cyclotransferase [Asaia sp. BMEF1]|uniref:glutaminyl-peptide cyclotransferase n=1 Tax=Asaia sp. BMEF1 TaxID=3155932 RepID=UPI003F663C98
MSRSRIRLFGLIISLGMAASFGRGAEAGEAVPVDQAEVIAVLPHDPTSFTEGLFYQDGALFESTGRLGHSVIRKVAPETGKVLAESVLPDGYFGEGIVAWHDKLISLTWRSGKGFVWSYPGLARIGSFSYAGEGWGLTHDDRTLIMSDGTPCLKRLDPMTLHVLAKLCVTAGGVPVRRLNELEYIHGEIWANIWMTPEIARIDPATGEVKSWLDLTALQENVNSFDPDAVANGIAYDRENDRLFVTGKYWPRVYQIKIPDRKHLFNLQ